MESVRDRNPEIDRLRRWEIFFDVSLVFLLIVTFLAWSWQEFLMLLFFGGTIQWFITESKRKLEAKAQLDSIRWLKHRLEVVDPHGVEDFGQITTKDSRLHPPSEEVLVHCPKCNRAIKRRELDRPYNGGWSPSET